MEPDQVDGVLGRARSPRRRVAGALLACAVIAAAVAVQLQPGGMWGPPAPARLAGEIAVIFVEVTVAIESVNQSGSLRVDTIELPHCTHAYYDEGALDVFTGRYGRPYDPSVRAIALLRYGGIVVPYGSADARDVTGDGAPVPAALNRSTELYRLFFGPNLTVAEGIATDNGGGRLAANYTVHGTIWDIAGGDHRTGDFVVAEMHTILVERGVPVYTKDALPCI